MQHSPIESKDQNTSNVIVHTNLNTTDTLNSVAKIITSSILPGWKLSRANHILMISNALIVKATTKLTLTFISSESIGLIINGI